MPTASTGASGQPFAFTGEPRDATGLSYLRARYYDPALGRFVSRDPWAGSRFSTQSLNRYAYARNAPTVLADPSGRCPWCIVTAAVGAAIGTGVYLVTTDSADWTLEGAAGAAVTGGVVGAVAGLAGPVAATVVADAGLGGLGGAAVEAGLAATINFAGGAAGTFAGSVVATGQPPSAREFWLGGLLAAGSGGIGGALFPLRGVTYASQIRYFTPRTVSGVFSTQPNSVSLWGNAAVDLVTSIVKSAVLR